MLIDQSHRHWALLTSLLFAFFTAIYVLYARTWPGGPSGRTWPGMLFGVASAMMMVFAALLAVRKKTLRLQIGSLSWWLKGHIWLGSLSIPLVFYHAAFEWGGTIEQLLWATLLVVTVSGFIGLAMQNLVPRMLKLQLSTEIVPEQYAEVCRRLVIAADEKIAKTCTSQTIAAALAQEPMGPSVAQADPHKYLAGFFVHSVRPFLGERWVGSTWGDTQQSEAHFDRVRSMLPDDCHAALDWLEGACNDRRAYARQMRLYNILHGWLKIHIPCSIVLLIFLVIHIVASLYY